MTNRSARAAAEAEVGPTARRRQVGIRLKALRDAAGMTVDEAGSKAGMSAANVSRYERGRGNVRWNQVDALCRAYGASEDDREALIDLAKNSKVTDGWWVPYAGRLSSPMRLLLAMEDEAPRIRQYTAGVIPGLLQTMDYARSIKETPYEVLSADDVDSYLSMRMRRQEILGRQKPPTFQVVLDEAVIRRVVGSPEVMVGQLDHLLEQGSLPHVTIQVLPFSAGAYGAALSSFIIYGGVDPSLDVIFIETSAGSLFLEEPGAREQYDRAISFLQEEALDEISSADLIAEASKSHLRRQK
ncbi:helix-turn-helix domain-containing protein [Streptomyces millisiae]|uniref:Helix-turn-helix transcriptional regulator n=1 Tax=Streptomyces millisiae TaxID=3075542 RepID=A0ABU2LWC1_9ACTN|nr:helix-turn-helix transcriptional regulator [Streptomyces sp. DSM 44918]MDT0321896.1 helix-turn-helix transcriptional regulator [Streptomyces sp. DSM 44918]